MEQTKALVLLNLGAARNKEELKEFLTNMFNDRDILTVKNSYFRSVLAKLITNSRLDKAWENYEKIGGKSPLFDITDCVLKKLQERMPDTFVTTAMRYTSPRAISCVEELKDKGIFDITLLPLFPQFSTTTTQTGVEEFIHLALDEFSIKTIKPFYKNDDFNQLICDEIIKQKEGEDDFNLVFSAHGLPQKIINSGDTYQKQIEEHVELLKAKLKKSGTKFKSISLAYQSKIGPLAWIKPSLDSTLALLKDSKILVYPISFMIDNSETDFELSVEYKEIAQGVGVKEYKVCKCPNDNDKTIDFVVGLVNG